MKTKEFFFELPQELIAQTPADRRGQSRLLILDRAKGTLTDSSMLDFANLLPADSLLVVNDSKVRKARVYGESENGGIVEFLFLEELHDHTWKAMVTKSKKQRVGKSFLFKLPDNSIVKHAQIIGEREGEKIVAFDTPIDESFFTIFGHVPLPPYIKRADTFHDESRYQTVYAQYSGSVAAPTAGLHFTQDILHAIEARGIGIAPVTLHVGPGTFLPVRVEDLDDHKMHFEHFEISENTASLVNKAHAEGRKVVAVGTTSVRTLESAYDHATGAVQPGPGSTNLFIKPPYRFAIVDHLLTNFHTPESTLLVLVSTFAGKETIMNAYRHAVAQRYRFFSYGDAMLIL
ncbi:MAG: tRNA preQ1(34) S-adenosylmethionine ribosyltransferase-isomerase QueA [Spirochaetae bacterium HGW-Spirochaetae-8]|nr:MAG: tRNA preQ1(34) S-adenosylmethionine ribosyltransferase-isomerase QueA [Spirochaetae bacterium HGW-Spirochaetae-8]